MRYEVNASHHEREWIVEAFNPEGDGEVYVAEFSGPDAKARAVEYAAWKNGLAQHAAVALPNMSHRSHKDTSAILEPAYTRVPWPRCHLCCLFALAVT
jgi:hypothetical protein